MQSGSDEPEVSVIIQGFQLRVDFEVDFRSMSFASLVFRSERITVCKFVQFPNKFRSEELMKKEKKG